MDRLVDILIEEEIIEGIASEKFKDNIQSSKERKEYQ